MDGRFGPPPPRLPWPQTLLAHLVLSAVVLLVLQPGFVRDERGRTRLSRVVGLSALGSALTACSCLLSPAELAWRGVAWASARASGSG